MNTEWRRYFNFHWVKGHRPKDCYQLKKEIETLIQERHMMWGRIFICVKQVQPVRLRCRREPHKINTIAGGFTRDGETSSTYKRYAHQILNIDDLSIIEGRGEPKNLEAKISLYEKDATAIHSHNDDPKEVMQIFYIGKRLKTFPRPSGLETH